MRNAIFVMIVFGLLLFVGCNQKAISDGSQMANPAAEFCKSKGGSLSIVEEAAGQRGICTLPDGKVCDEWAYYRGECPKSDCTDCPRLASVGPDFCKDGKIVPGIVNECGCMGPPKCEAIACTEDAKICPDGSAVGRVGPDCEFALCPENKVYCTDDQRGAVACTRDYNPVCGWFGKNVQCVKAPCAITAGNACTACANPDVEYYIPGECPT